MLNRIPVWMDIKKPRVKLKSKMNTIKMGSASTVAKPFCELNKQDCLFFIDSNKESLL